MSHIIGTTFYILNTITGSTMSYDMCMSQIRPVLENNRKTNKKYMSIVNVILRNGLISLCCHHSGRLIIFILLSASVLTYSHPPFDSFGAPLSTVLCVTLTLKADAIIRNCRFWVFIVLLFVGSILERDCVGIESKQDFGHRSASDHWLCLELVVLT